MGNNYKHNEISLNKDHKAIEQKCLIFTSILNLILAIVEIVFYFLTYRISILFDGIFSSVMTLTTLIAFLLTFFIKKKSFNYPFGKSIYDNIFSLFKNLLLIVISIIFIINSSIDISDLANNKYIYEKEIEQSLYISYVVVSCLMSLIITTVYFIYSKTLSHKSVIIKAEIKSSIFDFMISFFIGFSLLISSITSNSMFIKEIIDKSLTLFLSVIMIPINVRSFIIDLLIISGYRIFKNEEKDLIEHLNEKAIVDIYIQRHNSRKNFLIKLDIHKCDNNVIQIKQKIINHIYDHYLSDTNIYFIV